MLALSRFFCVNFGRGPDWPDVTGGVWGPGCGLDGYLDEEFNLLDEEFNLLDEEFILDEEFNLLGSPKHGNSS